MGAARLVGRAIAVIVPVAFLGAFFALPVVTIVARGLGADGLDALLDLARSPRQRDVVWFTTWQAVVSTGLTLLVALPGAAMVAGLGERRRRLVRVAVTVPFVLPTVVVAGAFDALFSRFGLDEGALRLRHTVWAILLAHVFFNYAVVVRVVGSYWAGLDGRLEDQARLLGASRWRTFVGVTLPRLRPAIASASAIVFLFTFTSFGVVLVLGGPRLSTIETEIYRFAVVRSDLTTAAALATVQVVMVLGVVVVSTMLERRAAVPAVGRPRPAVRSTRRWVVGNVVVIVVLLGLPVLVLVEQSLRVGEGWSLRHYGALAHRVPQLPAPATTALLNSLSFAVVATGIAMVVGGLTALVVVHGRKALGRAYDLGLTLPLGVSAVTIGFGMLLALDEPPLDLRTSWVIVPIAHALIGIPFVVRTLVPMLRSIDESLREAAAVLGASPGRVRRHVDLPIAGRGLAVGAGFAFAVSLGEFGATSFLPRSPDRVTAPVALFRLLGAPGDLLRGQAMALAVVLMVLVAVAVFVIESVRGPAEGGF